MTPNSFAEWQPKYAAFGISTFPVNGKTPAVRGYLRVGPAASRALAARHGEATAFGLALRPAGITVLDVDTPDERLLADALNHHGMTPFVVRSGSGNFQAWYRRQNEGRRIRPDPAVPIDILGKGFVVAPPSAGARGSYRILEGTLADLAHLPVLRNAPQPATPARAGKGPGARNDTLWRRCMEEARHCDDFDALLDVARTHNAAFCPPLPDAEVVKTARSAWGYTERGENRFGQGRRIMTTHEEVDGLMHDHPDAYLLLMLLRRHHGGRTFVVANAMAETMPGGGWSSRRFAAARRCLEEAQLTRRCGRRAGIAVPPPTGSRVDDFDHQ